MFKKLVKTFFLKLGYDITPLQKDDKNVYAKYYNKDSIKNKKFYNIGAGGFNHPYWTNIDYESDWYSHYRENNRKGIQYDLLSLKPIPIDANSAEIFYTSHTIEHISNEAAQFVFNEVYNILKPGGVFRITTPNIELLYNMFKQNDFDFYYNCVYRLSLPPLIQNGVEVTKDKKKASIEQLFLFSFASSVSTLHNLAKKQFTDKEIRKILSEKDFTSALNYFISYCSFEIQRKFPGNHINWWNKEKIFEMLKNAGFTNMYLSAYGQSSSPVLRNIRYFDNTNPKMSLYVEAIK